MSGEMMRLVVTNGTAKDIAGGRRAWENRRRNSRAARTPGSPAARGSGIRRTDRGRREFEYAVRWFGRCSTSCRWTTRESVPG